MAYFPSQAGQDSGSAYGDLQSYQPAQLDPTWLDEGLVPASVGHPESAVALMVDAAQTANQIRGSNLATSSGTTRGGEESLIRTVEGSRIAFKTESEVDILEDGFKWRRNGQYVKNNSYRRIYYRCSTEGCSVKKWVQRDKEDPSYVITNYEGRHNHMEPGVVYSTTRLQVHET